MYEVLLMYRFMEDSPEEGAGVPECTDYVLSKQSKPTIIVCENRRLFAAYDTNVLISIQCMFYRY